MQRGESRGTQLPDLKELYIQEADILPSPCGAEELQFHCQALLGEILNKIQSETQMESLEDWYHSLRRIYSGQVDDEPHYVPTRVVERMPAAFVREVPRSPFVFDEE